MGPSSSTDGGDGLQIWRVPANVMIKQPRTKDKGWSFIWGVYQGANNTLPSEIQTMLNVTHDLRHGKLHCNDVMNKSVTLRLIWHEQNVRVWIGLIWLSTRTSGGLLWTREWTNHCCCEWVSNDRNHLCLYFTQICNASYVIARSRYS